MHRIVIWHLYIKKLEYQLVVVQAQLLDMCVHRSCSPTVIEAEWRSRKMPRKAVTNH